MRSFFDTNVLVYAVDEDEPEKSQIARDLFDSETSRGTAAISTQVLQEFYVVVTRKLDRPVEPELAERLVEKLSELPVTQIDPRMVLSGIGRSRTSRISFWDALIVESALASGAERLYSEDIQSDLEIDGLRIENPFE